MVETTVQSFAAYFFLALHGLVHQRMKHLFFPSMTSCAVTLQWTPILILSDEITSLPIFTEFKRTVPKEMGFTPEVLPVMSIHALSFVMLMVKGTPFSFEVEHKEFPITRYFV